MEFTHGKSIVLNGSSKQLRHLTHYFAAAFFHLKKKILIIDTINCLNLHSPVFSGIDQEKYFNSIYCVRTPMPYDLWARLNTASGFIGKNRINVLLIASLSLLFKDAPIREVEPMVLNILEQVDYLTKEHNLITVIGNSPSDDPSAQKAHQLLSKEQNVRELIA